MSNYLRGGLAIGIGFAFMLSGSQVNAAAVSCGTSLANSGDAGCKAIAKCAETIVKETAKYQSGVQKEAANLLKESQGGKLTSGPKYACEGGTNAGGTCLADVGVCKKNPKGAPCIDDTECDGSLGSCDYTKGCFGGECNPNTAKNLGSKGYEKAKAKLVAGILKKCAADGATDWVDPDDIGVNNMPCPVAIPTGGGASLATAQQTYRAVAQCIQRSVVGDYSTGNVQDTILDAIAKASPLDASLLGAKAGTLDDDPRMLWNLQGANVLQIGSGIGSSVPSVGTGGTVTYISTAACVGGNGSKVCISHKDCGTDSGGTAGTCVSNFAGGVATGNGNTPAGHTLALTAGCTPVTLSGLAQCLHTRTTNAGNGTGALVTVNLTTGSYDSYAPILTDVFISGAGVDLTPGGCSAYHACPVCKDFSGVAKCEGECIKAADPNKGAAQGVKCTNTTGCAAGFVCTVGILGTDVPCTNVSDDPTLECSPEIPAIAAIPNPYTLSTTPGLLNEAIPSSGILCGNCSVSIGIGCQVNADCPAAETCSFAGPTVAPGAFGDLTVSSINSPGRASVYAPLLGGTFCTGTTGDVLIDGSTGLPGPVRFVAQELHGYVFTKDKTP